MPRIAPWSHFTRSLRDSLSQLSNIIPTSTFFIVTMQDGFFTLVRLFHKEDENSNDLTVLRLSELTGFELMHQTQSLVIADTANHVKGESLAAQRIGAYMGVPILLQDGTLYGTLCTANVEPYDFNRTELHSMQLAADMLAYVIELERMAIHDPLTGALNRLFLERYRVGLQKEFGEAFALIYIDLDGFKTVNDMYGHECGDSVLRVIVQRLKRRIRMEDVVVRVGGDEFVVVLTDIIRNGNVVSNVVQRLSRSLDVEYSIDSRQFRVSASLGVSIFPQDGRDFETLIQAADKAMYSVKHQGGKGFSIYSEEMVGKLVGDVKSSLG